MVLRDANRTLGGGLAAMELLRRTASRAAGCDDAEHGVLVAASRLTPGTNVLAYCVGLGWKLPGPPARGGGAGGVVARAPSSSPLMTAAGPDRPLPPSVPCSRVGTIVAAGLVLAAPGRCCVRTCRGARVARR